MIRTINWLTLALLSFNYHGTLGAQETAPDAGHRFPATERPAADTLIDGKLTAAASQVDLDRGLLAHWPLRGDVVDMVTGTASGEIQGPVDLRSSDRSAGFFGSGSWLEIPATKAPRLAGGDFSLAAWVRCDEADPRGDGQLTGDLISQYDPRSRRGFQLSLKSAAGVTSNQPNWRHLQFGIDDDRSGAWRDCGRPGEAVFGFALAVHEGALYAGTCEAGQGQAGTVYRYGGEQNWIDCGAPDRSNSVTSLAVYRGQLYAGTGKYRLAGSSLTESENEQLGGRVFRYAGGKQWVLCGELPDTEAIGGLVVFKDRLHASSLYRPAGFFRYEPETQTWSRLPVPQGLDATTQEIADRRVEAMTVFGGYLYASSYDGGHVYRFDSEGWLDCGRLGDNTQTYSFAQYDGRLYVGTWPSGRVYRFEEPNRWSDVGRLGEELEVMGMMVHNGRLFAGTLPLAEVYAFNGTDAWQRLKQLDTTPDVRFRRAWTMAEHDGELFTSTLPSGKIFAYTQGAQVSWGHPLPSRWCHVAATQSDQRLTLYLDGVKVSQSPLLEGEAHNLDTQAPLRIGAGMNGTLNGQLSDVRIYGRALEPREVGALATRPPTAAER